MKVLNQPLLRVLHLLVLAVNPLLARQMLIKNAQTQMQQLPLVRQPLRCVSVSNKTQVRSCKWLPDMKT
jgi:hypothetical protein